MNIEAPDGEDLIVQRLQTGDSEAFAALYNHYYPFVLSHVTHLMHSPALADDVTQEVFMRIWENRSRMEQIRSFKSYLFITARNHTLNVLKRASRSQAAISEIVRQFDRYRNFTEEQVQDQEYMRFINKKIAELPPRSREIFRMCREQSKSYNEVAEELGISRDAVKSRMVHAIKAFRDSVNNGTGFPLALLLVLLTEL